MENYNNTKIQKYKAQI